MRMLIADNQAKVRFAVRVALENQPGFKTIDEASDAEDLLTHVRTVCPDLAIVDWELPGMPVGELIGLVRQMCSATRVLVLNSRPETREPALAAGANAFVCMGDAPDDLLSAIDHCLAAKELIGRPTG